MAAVDGASPGKVASTGHTACLLVALLAVSVRAAMSGAMEEWPRTLSEPGARYELYVQIVALQWVWVGYVWFGVRRWGGRLRTLIDPAPWTARRLVRYGFIGIVGVIFWLAVSSAYGALLPLSSEQLQGVAAMLPHTSGERLLWLGFAASAGICEEVVYRGYLLRQFSAATGRPWLAVPLQALVYGGIHLALPLQVVLSVVLLGALLGAVAVWQRSLVPGMILHSVIGMIAILGSLSAP